MIQPGANHQEAGLSSGCGANHQKAGLMMHLGTSHQGAEFVIFSQLCVGQVGGGVGQNQMQERNRTKPVTASFFLMTKGS